MYVARAPINGGQLVSPYIKDESAVINPAEDITVSITTVSQQLYTKYAEHYKAGEYDNDYFILLSTIGIGNQDEPTLKVHEIQHIDTIDRDITDLWADTVLAIEDFGKDDSTKRIYLSFHTFCQNLGGSSFDKLKNSFSKIIGLTGSIFPGLAPWTSIGRVVVDGVNNILHKLINIKGETKSVTFSFYPFDSDATGDAPLQTGSFVMFFEETEIDNLRLENNGIVYSTTGKDVNPYIVVNVKNKLVLSPEQLKTSAAVEILDKYNSGYGYPLPKEREPALKYLDALLEFGNSYKLAQYTDRYFQLKRKGAQRTDAENKRFNKLSQILKTEYKDWDSEPNL